VDACAARSSGCAAALREAAGVAARFYRPPFGIMTPGQATQVRGLGYEPVLGDVYPGRPHRPGVDRIVGARAPRLTAGSILILHDGSPLGDPDRGQTMEALETILPRRAPPGAQAVTVRDLCEGRPPPGRAEAHIARGRSTRIARPFGERPSAVAVSAVAVGDLADDREPEARAGPSRARGRRRSRPRRR